MLSSKWLWNSWHREDALWSQSPERIQGPRGCGPCCGQDLGDEAELLGERAGVGLSFREKGGGEERGERPGEEGRLASLGEGEMSPSSIRSVCCWQPLSATILLGPASTPSTARGPAEHGGTLEFAQVVSVLNATENLGRVCTSVCGLQWFIQISPSIAVNVCARLRFLSIFYL